MTTQTTSPLTIDWTAIRASAVTSIAQLDAIAGVPTSNSINKQSVTMTPLKVAFERSSPFYLLATSAPDGSCDVTPRGTRDGGNAAHQWIGDDHGARTAPMAPCRWLG